MEQSKKCFVFVITGYLELVVINGSTIQTMEFVLNADVWKLFHFDIWDIREGMEISKDTWKKTTGSM